MRLATDVARRHGIDAPVQSLRAGVNHVFLAGDAVIRIAPRSADVPRQVALARWLRSEGFLVAVPLGDAEIVGDASVSLWERIDAGHDRPIDFEQLGAVVSRLHRISSDRLREVVTLPFCGDAAWLGVEQRLRVVEEDNLLSGDGVAALKRECTALRGWRDRARQQALVVCHGDLHPSNVLMRGDDVVIIDWDAVCLGPPAWDHAPLMTWADRWGGDATTYEDFSLGYGRDLRGSPLAKELARLRLLAPTINMIINGATNAACAAEAETRMRYWLGDPAAPAWTPL